MSEGLQVAAPARSLEIALEDDLLFIMHCTQLY